MSEMSHMWSNHANKESGPTNVSEIVRYVGRRKKSKKAYLEGLSFDAVVANKALPPHSLNDFMDYLVSVERSEENLQFFLWYRDYERRFNDMPETEKALSPKWMSAESKLRKDTEMEDVKFRRSKLQSVIERGYNGKGTALLVEECELVADGHRHGSLLMINDRRSRIDFLISDSGEAPTLAEATAQAGLKWQPFSVQPMREEVNRIMRHYLAFNSPQELNLSHKDRAQCLHALQHTTHPSAFKVVIFIAESALRTQSHPNFVRWSITRGNKPRVFSTRTMVSLVAHLGRPCVPRWRLDEGRGV